MCVKGCVAWQVCSVLSTSKMVRIEQILSIYAYSAEQHLLRCHCVAIKCIVHAMCKVFLPDCSLKGYMHPIHQQFLGQESRLHMLCCP